MTFVLSSFIKINSKNQAGLEGSLGHLVSRLSWIFEPIFGKKKCQYFFSLIDPSLQVARSGKQYKFSALRFIFFGRNYRKVCCWIKRGWRSCSQHFHLSQIFLYFFSQNLFCFPDRATWEYFSWNVGSRYVFYLVFIKVSYFEG